MFGVRGKVEGLAELAKALDGCRRIWRRKRCAKRQPRRRDRARRGQGARAARYRPIDLGGLRLEGQAADRRRARRLPRWRPRGKALPRPRQEGRDRDAFYWKFLEFGHFTRHASSSRRDSGLRRFAKRAVRQGRSLHRWPAVPAAGASRRSAPRSSRDQAGASRRRIRKFAASGSKAREQVVIDDEIYNLLKTLTTPANRVYPVAAPGTASARGLHRGAAHRHGAGKPSRGIERPLPLALSGERDLSGLRERACTAGLCQGRIRGLVGQADACTWETTPTRRTKKPGSLPRRPISPSGMTEKEMT
jgi:hypothetical protein